jgi:CDP-diacylglycerol--glycerol-3-phosphate 3-phosphatidyltransferase
MARLSDPPPPSRRWRRLRRRKPRLDPAVAAQRRRSLKQDAFNVPNLLTMGRIVIIPLVLWLLDSGTPRDCAWAAIVYGAAAITDLLDGYLARKMNVVSVLGKFLDPLADKLLVMACLVWMVPMGRIPEWAVALLLAREISVTGLRSIASSEGVVIAAGEGGKSKTALQMIGIIALIVGFPYHLSLGPLDLGVVDLVVVGRTLVYISLIFSITSAFQYVGLFAEAVEAKEKRGGGPAR